MKKTLYFLLVSIVMSSIFFSFSCKTNSMKGLTEKSEKDISNTHEIQIVRPFLNSELPFASAVHDFIEERILIEKNNFLKKEQEYIEAGGTHQLVFFVDWKLYRYDNSVFSALIRIYTYLGGAHGSTELVPINFNMENGEEITIENLGSYIAKMKHTNAKSLPELLHIASVESKKQIKSKIRLDKNQELENEWFNEGLSPTRENFALFTLTKKNLIFQFKEYQIAAYVYGNLESSINYKKF